MIFWYFVEGVYENHESALFSVPSTLEYEGTLVLRDSEKRIPSKEVLTLSGIRFGCQSWEFPYITYVF
jgi:hypothetical protein